MRPADELHWVNMSVEADEVLASFNWYSASTDMENSTVAVSMAEEIIKLRAAIERVRALHRQDPERKHCWECQYGLPCRTLRALDGEDA